MLFIDPDLRARAFTARAKLPGVKFDPIRFYERSGLLWASGPNILLAVNCQGCDLGVRN